MDATHDGSATSIEDGPVSPELIAAVAGAFDVVVFAVVGQFALEDPIAGGVAGLFVGAGIYLFLPAMMHAQERGGFEAMASPGRSNPVRKFHRLAGGFALSTLGLLTFASQFADLGLTFGLAVAIVAAALVYLVAGFALPNAKP